MLEHGNKRLSNLVNAGKGRKEGSEQSSLTTFKKRLKDYLSPGEVEQMIKDAVIMAKKDTKILIFLLEQVFGKATQYVEQKSTTVETSVELSPEEHEDVKQALLASIPDQGSRE